MKSAAARFLIWAFAFGLAACLFDQEKVAGGEDFPNTLQPLGKVASTSISSHGQWDQFQEIPPVPDVKPADSVTIPPPSAVLILAKGATGAAIDTLWDYRDTATLGVVRKIIVDSALLANKIRRDTLTYRWNDAFRDSIPGNDLLLEARGYLHTRIPYKLQPYRFVNLDSAGGFDQADYVLILKGADSALRIQRYRVLAGSDHDIATKADNPMVEYEYLRIRVRDTLDWVQALDADGDGMLWGAGDSGVVVLRQRSVNPGRTPQAESLSLALKVKIYRKGDSSAPLSYRERRVLKNGVITVFSANGIRGDSLLQLGDTALVTFGQTYPADASLLETQGRFFVRLGARPWHFEDNALLYFDASTRWRSGAIRAANLAFTPDAPIVSGQTGIQGSFTISLVYEDGGTGEVSGDFHSGSIKTTLHELRAGIRKGFRLVFDAQGNLVTQELLPQ